MSNYEVVTVEGGVVTALRENVLLGRGNNADYSTTVTLRPTGDIGQLVFLFPPGECGDTSIIMPAHRDETIEIVEGAAAVQGHIQFASAGASDDVFDASVEIDIEHPARLTSFYRSSGDEGMREMRIVVAYDGDAPPAQIWHSELDRDGNVIEETEAAQTLTDPDDPQLNMKKVELHLHDVGPGRILGFRWVW